jgi:hypothetical protein
MIAVIFRRIVPVNIFVWQSIGLYYLSLFRRGIADNRKGGRRDQDLTETVNNENNFCP